MAAGEDRDDALGFRNHLGKEATRVAWPATLEEEARPSSDLLHIAPTRQLPPHASVRESVQG